MPASFPTSVKTFTTKSNNVNTVNADDINDIQEEINAIETFLGTSPSRRVSWTPAFTWATPGTSTWTYSTRGGYVQTIGGLVMASAYVTGTPTIGTGAGQLYITGLPFDAINASIGFFPISLSNSSGFTTYPTAGLLYNNSDVIRIYRSTNVADTLTTAHVTGGTAITMIFSLFYWTA